MDLTSAIAPEVDAVLAYDCRLIESAPGDVGRLVEVPWRLGMRWLSAHRLVPLARVRTSRSVPD